MKKSPETKISDKPTTMNHVNSGENTMTSWTSSLGVKAQMYANSDFRSLKLLFESKAGTKTIEIEAYFRRRYYCGQYPLLYKCEDTESSVGFLTQSKLRNSIGVLV